MSGAKWGWWTFLAIWVISIVALVVGPGSSDVTVRLEWTADGGCVLIEQAYLGADDAGMHFGPLIRKSIQCPPGWPPATPEGTP